ncbi:MAG: SDR family NAD(P)-dependent oxidoreductase [Desulfobacterales bacterium]|nr:SDR family NAD(P)-dependent oxidoreductase [Desulfobacterales bacterium]MDX2511198.1 SDR family NAD(P)-dependent oxidoreductase [Desulfobacterales bacterium]
MTNSAFDLTGKSVLVTGGNSGIGLGMADAVAGAGADVCIWSRNERRNKAAVEKIKRHDHKIFSLECDVSNQEQVEECFSQTVSSLGKVDACFANAGTSWLGTPFHKMTIEEWRAILDVNLNGVFFTLKPTLAHMVAQGNGGSVVITSSISAKFGMSTGEHYAATKAGVTSIVRSIAVEYARYHIRANAILPGWIETNMTAPLFENDTFSEKMMKRIPQRRWGVPEDFGPIAIYFSSDASAYHTGDSVTIDGGFSCF